MAYSDPLQYWTLFSSVRTVKFPSICTANEIEAEHFIENIFQQVIDSLMLRYCVHDDDIKTAISHLKFNYSHVSKGCTPEELNFNTMSNCLGYLHRYAAGHAVLVYKALRRVLNVSQCWTLDMKLAMEADSMNLVCLGSGPGNDFVGFLRALCTHRKLNYLDVTVVDKMEGWKIIFSEIVRKMECDECLNEEFNMVNIRTCFIQIDLISQSISRQLFLKMMNANVVLLVKFLSNVPDTYKLRTLTKIVNCMKSGALLVFIDCPYPSEVFSALSNCLSLAYDKCSEKFRFDSKLNRFGYDSMKSSTAAVKIFVKRICV